MLAIDIGNSYLKWKIWDKSGVVIASGSTLSDDDNRESMFDFASQYHVEKVVLANVAKSTIEKQLMQWFSQAEQQIIKSSARCLGVTNAYEDVERLGVDRWLAMIEAYHVAGKVAVCVIDLGTAATLDVVDSKGQHQGGYIVPGLGLMRSALLQSTQRVKVDSDTYRSTGYGKNTSEAVEGGVHNLMVSWLDAEIAKFRQAYAQGAVFVTGGDGEQIAALLSDKRITVYKELLLDGLRRVALQ